MATHWIGEPADAPPPPSAPDTSSWWRVFNDPTLDRLVDEAYRNNLSLQAAAAHILAAQAQLYVAIGELFPQQQALGAGVQREHQGQSTLIAPGLNPWITRASWA